MGKTGVTRSPHKKKVASPRKPTSPRSRRPASPRKRTQARPASAKFHRFGQTRAAAAAALASPASQKSIVTEPMNSLTREQLDAANVVSAEDARSLIDEFNVAGEDTATTTNAKKTHVPLVDYDGGRIPASLKRLIEYVNNPKFKESWRLVRWVHATQKHAVYAASYLRVQEEANAREAVLREKARTLGIPDSDSWKTLSEDDLLGGLMEEAARFKQLLDHCALLRQNLESNATVARLDGVQQSISVQLQELKKQLHTFAKKVVHFEIADYVARTLLACYQNPYLVRKMFFTLMLTGPAGIGKTTIAQQISNLLSRSGLFEGGFSDKTKPDFIGQFLGETPHRTRKALTSGALDGVLLIDEAYSLCNLDRTKGEVDQYGQEFASTLVDFMTRYKGLYCLVVAGYEAEMKEQFMAANEGIGRRFPHRFVLEDLDESQMTTIVRDYTRKVRLPSLSESEYSSSNDPLTKEASEFFQQFVTRARTDPNGKYALKVLQNQAGSASNLAEFINLIVESRDGKTFFKANDGIVDEAAIKNHLEKRSARITKDDVKEAILSVVLQSELSNKYEATEAVARLLR